jgi:tetratricopeptide (TPR) repeat protein
MSGHPRKPSGRAGSPKPSGSQTSQSLFQRWGGLAFGLILVAGTLLLYWPAVRFAFVDFDDPVYVSDNPHVQAGLTWSGLKWALTATDAANWHPLTWLSHMLDCQIYGPKAGGHHFTNILLHMVNSCLVFALMLRLTRRAAPSFVIAALFAWHPLHVESVAWVAERKDVLSTCFGLLSLLAYQAYATNARDQTSSQTANVRNIIRYSSSLLFFVLSLISKPMFVTLPFVMLLLDYWPLGRIGMGPAKAPWKRIALEKLPFLLLAALSCAVTLRVQAHGGALAAIRDFPLELRIGNVERSYYQYLWKSLWPQHLAVFYPFEPSELTPLSWLAGGLLVILSVLVLRLRTFPFLAVGWFWYLGTLVPVIGLVQVGSQAMADRYTYFPAIGIFILAVFGARELAVCIRSGTAILAGASSLTLLACLIMARQQVSYWRNSETLFHHAIEVTQGNFVACNNLGVALEARGEKAEATQWYLEALRMKPDYADAHCNLADCYIALKRPREAISEFQAALRLNPRLARAHYLLANQLLAEDEVSAAEDHYEAALAIKPDYAEAHYQMAVVLLAEGKAAESTFHYRAALRLKPDWIEALNNLAWLLATSPEPSLRNGNQSLELAARGVKLTYTNDARLLDTLGAALAELGRFSDAINASQTGSSLAKASRETDLEKEIEEHVKEYQKRQPIRETSPARPLNRK